jgi:LCP family protein required for cell wall assembly
MQYKFQRLFAPRVKRVSAIAIGLLIIFIAFQVLTRGMRFMRDTGMSPGTLLRLAFDSGAPLKMADDRTNILLLGIPGGSRPGADLTDSMMVLSFHHKTKTLTLISLPRDIWSDTLKDKINSAYHYGEEKRQGGGLVLAKVVAEDIVGTPIHYGLVIDFSGFRRVIDDAGGIDVAVAQGFTDADFPIEGKEEDLCDSDPKFRCRYESIHFDAGTQHTDGTTALKYVRSRHAEGEEGTDFARGRRQQEVIVALKEKLTNPATWMRFGQNNTLLQSLDAATDTDMNLGEVLTFGKLASRVAEKFIQRVSIEDQLMTPPLWMYGGKYVLTPKEDFVKLHEYVKKIL